ncbi:MAG TPA: hypothetical protein VF746_08235 [Longimicrobium sp.]|jgi:hypothetical protein
MRCPGLSVALPLLLVVAARGAAAQQDTARARPSPAPVPVQRAAQGGAQTGTSNYDVVLEVPNLSVDSIGLTVADVRAHLALDANAANLVTLVAGADISIQRVQLELVGVRAEAYVYVDLDNVARIVNRVLATLDRNPQILTQVLTTVDTLVGTVGGVAGAALRPGGVAEQAVGAVGRTLDNATRPGGLLSQTVNTLGQTVQTTLGQTGGIVERTLNTAGQVVGTRTLGSVTTLPLVRTATNAAGQTVRTVRHASGALIEYTLDQAGRVLNARVVQQAAGPR